MTYLFLNEISAHADGEGRSRAGNRFERAASEGSRRGRVVGYLRIGTLILRRVPSACSEKKIKKDARENGLDDGEEIVQVVAPQPRVLPQLGVLEKKND